MAVNSLIQPVNMASPQFKANPFPFYAQLRAEAPVYRMTINRPANNPLWIITRYQDVASVLKDERFAKDPNHALPSNHRPKTDWRPAFFQLMDNNMLKMDAPDHTRLRVLVHKVFTPVRCCWRIDVGRIVRENGIFSPIFPFLSVRGATS